MNSEQRNTLKCELQTPRNREHVESGNAGKNKSMRLTRRKMLAGLAGGVLSGACGAGRLSRARGGERRRRTDELVLCGWDEVFILAVPREAGRESEARKVYNALIPPATKPFELGVKPWKYTMCLDKTN